MATAAATPLSATLEPIETIYSVALDDIADGKRLRPVDPDWAAALGAIMRRDGQQIPIEVAHNRKAGGPDFVLVAGAHRLAGARLVGMARIQARIVNATGLDLRLREVAENLWRRGLDPIDRASFVAEMHDILRARVGLSAGSSPQSIAANARWKKQLKSDAGDASVTMTDAYGFTGDIAAYLGLSQSAIERDLMLHRRLPAGIHAELRGHAVLGNAAQLRALARLDEHEQRRVIASLSAGSTKTVSEALAKLRDNRRPQPEDKRLSAFIGAFQRMGLSEKKGALAQLVDMLPAPWRLIEGAIQRWTFPPDHERYRDEALARLDAARDVLEALIEDGAVDEDRIEAVQAAARGIYDTYGTIATDAIEVRRPA